MSNWSVNEKRIDIPYTHEHSYVCVEYPGKVVNDDKALETIGGSKHVAKAYSNPAKRLSLHYRPEDKYCKPMYGDRIAATNLLMRVKKRKRKSDGVVEYSVEILGMVETMYKFQGMCDFQYMPMKKLPDDKYDSILEQVQISTISDRQEYLTRDVPLFIPPLSFSRVDRPCDFLYRQNIEHRGQYKNPDVNRPPNLIGTVRQRRSIHTIFVNFGEPIPKAPIPEAVKRLTAEFVDPKGEQTIKKLLEEKPLWLKVELEHRTGYRGEKLKTFLPALCFYWLDGPWRAQWNKIGYNPTKDVAAKIYQTIDFRIRQAKPGQTVVKAKRTDLRMTQWNTTTRNQKHNVKIDLGALGGAEGKKGKKKAIAPEVDKEIFYKFKPDKIPPHRMMYYPVCYVEIDEVQILVHQNDGKETSCTEKDGWCSPDFNEHVREIMYKYVNRLLQQDDNVEMRFWRSKKVKKRNEMLSMKRSDEDSEGSDRAGKPKTSKSDSTLGEGTNQSAQGTSDMDAGNDGESSMEGALGLGQDTSLPENNDMGETGSLAQDTISGGNQDEEATSVVDLGSIVSDNAENERKIETETSSVDAANIENVGQEPRLAEPGTNASDGGGSTDQLVPDMPT